MQRNKVGIPVNVSVKCNPLTIKVQKENARKAKRKRTEKANARKKRIQSEYERYTQFVTMTKREGSEIVHTMVPKMHADFGKALADGYEVVEFWTRKKLKYRKKEQTT